MSASHVIFFLLLFTFLLLLFTFLFTGGAAVGQRGSGAAASCGRSERRASATAGRASVGGLRAERTANEHGATAHGSREVRLPAAPASDAREGEGVVDGRRRRSPASALLLWLLSRRRGGGGADSAGRRWRRCSRARPSDGGADAAGHGWRRLGASVAVRRRWPWRRLRPRRCGRRRRHPSLLRPPDTVQALRPRRRGAPRQQGDQGQADGRHRGACAGRSRAHGCLLRRELFAF